MQALYSEEFEIKAIPILGLTLLAFSLSAHACGVVDKDNDGVEEPIYPVEGQSPDSLIANLSEIKKLLPMHNILFVNAITETCIHVVTGRFEEKGVYHGRTYQIQKVETGWQVVKTIPWDHVEE